ncbi:MAG TPA: hypothetical protein VGP09_23910 [Caballeronia sp.]|nr:hypothetical protein [Caballeronia sp.]
MSRQPAASRLLRAKTLFDRDDDRVHFGHHLKDAPRKTLPADIGKVLKVEC